MTKEQEKSLDRVRATWHNAHYNDCETAVYHTDDMGDVLLYLQQLEDKLQVVKNDLEDMRGHPELVGLTLMIDSTLMFLTEK